MGHHHTQGCDLERCAIGVTRYADLLRDGDEAAFLRGYIADPQSTDVIVAVVAVRISEAWRATSDWLKLAVTTGLRAAIDGTAVTIRAVRIHRTTRAVRDRHK